MQTPLFHFTSSTSTIIAMLTINDLKSKLVIMIDGAPYRVLEVKHLHMGRGGSSVQTRIRNLATGQTFSRNFKPADTFAQADIEKRELVFLYGHRGEYVFAPKPSAAAGAPAEGLGAVKGKPSERVMLDARQVGDAARWLKPQTPVIALVLDGAILSITVPIKMDFKVTAAPPGLRGDTVSGTTKAVTTETGEKIQTPLFVNEGDVIRINTETGEYAERVSKE